jgi:uncharacterized protein
MNYAIVTGASKGIGKAIAFELAKRNISVILVARNVTELATISTEIIAQYKVDAKYFAIDLSEENASQKLVDWCSKQQLQISILINNAGYGLSGSFENYSLKEHEAMMQLNMHVPVALTYLLLPELKKQSKAFVMNIASAAAYQAVPGLNVYAASKSFVLSFSRGLSYELKKTSVSVTAISPGATDTAFAARANVTSEKAQKMAAQFNMQPAVVAKQAVDAMFAQKVEVVTGFVNKFTVFLAWLLPKSILEKSAAGIYDL